MQGKREIREKIMSFVLFDTEYIADKGLLEEGFDGWKNREIIQIAAIKVDDDLNVMEEFNFYIKPSRHKLISEYFVNLTGITNEVIVKEGKNFGWVYDKFKSFTQGLPCYSHSWSFEDENDADGAVMREMLTYYGIEDAQQPLYKNIAFWFREEYQRRGINIVQQSSGEVAALLGVGEELEKMKLQPHNAFYDVYSTLLGLRFLGFTTGGKK